MTNILRIHLKKKKPLNVFGSLAGILYLLPKFTHTRNAFTYIRTQHARSLIPVQIWCDRLDVHRKPSSSAKVASVARTYDRRLVTSALRQEC